MKKWLVISHCQTLGLANCLSLLCPQVEVEMHDIWSFSKVQLELKEKLHDFDCLILQPGLNYLELVDFQSHKNIIQVPGVWFAGFHPDICYLKKNGEYVKGVMSDYHSLIIFVAYKNNIPEEKVKALFCERVFRALSYFGGWLPEREFFLRSFLDVGIDLRNDFLRWSRSGTFMHSMNHPHIEVLYDISKKIANKAGEPTVCSNIRPHDNLILGPVVPVYPELGAYFGFSGDYNFKPPGTYKLISLDEFISNSYKTYRDLGVDDIEATSYRYPAVNRILLELV